MLFTDKNLYICIISQTKSYATMGIFDFLFGKKNPKQAPQPSKIPTIEEFSTLNVDDRMRIIMLLGDEGNLASFPYIQYAIEHDNDANVKFAALKRVHNFKAHPDVLPMMTSLKNSNVGEALEPYFSMALSRLGIISFEEFEKKINKPE